MLVAQIHLAGQMRTVCLKPILRTRPKYLQWVGIGDLRESLTETQDQQFQDTLFSQCGFEI